MIIPFFIIKFRRSSTNSSADYWTAVLGALLCMHMNDRPISDPVRASGVIYHTAEL